MKHSIKNALAFTLLLMGILAWAMPARTQVPSPPARAACKFSDGKMIKVIYASPRMRGRKIFGDLVPYGEEWRVGADEATMFETNTDLRMGGKDVPAGRYTLFALPTPAKWTLILSKKIGEWGIPYPGAQFDFARIEMKVSKLGSPLENFTISFDETGQSCALKLDWETTRAALEMSEKK